MDVDAALPPTFQVQRCESCDETVLSGPFLDRCVRGELLNPKTFEHAGICRCQCHRGNAQMTRVPMPGSPSGFVLRETHYHDTMLVGAGR